MLDPHGALICTMVMISAADRDQLFEDFMKWMKVGATK